MKLTTRLHLMPNLRIREMYMVFLLRPHGLDRERLILLLGRCKLFLGPKLNKCWVSCVRVVGPSGRPLAGIVGSNSARGHGCLSVVIVVCCQVEVSATS